MNRLRKGLAVAAVVLAFVPACQTDDATAPADANVEKKADDTTAGMTAAGRTPFQLAIMQTIARRTAQGLPVPSRVSFEYETGLGTGPVIKAGRQSTVIAKTVLHFDNPVQAGHEKWPDFVVRNNGLGGVKGVVKEGDYTQIIKEKTAERLPGVWERYQFGQEPRTYTFNEQYAVTNPEVNAGLTLATSTFADQVLMGLTIPGPNLDYTIDFDVEVCVPVVGCATIVDFLAGFRLDWTLGLRLPMEVSLTSTEPLSEGSTYFPTSAARGVDWSAEEYEEAGVPPVEGNEYVVRFVFVLGVFLEVFGADVIDVGPNINIDKTSSFTTPFGPGAVFALPPLDITLWDFDASVASGEVGFRLTPNVGSDKFTADWAASSEASGSGNLTYTDPAVPVAAGPLLAIDGPGVANIKLDALKYYFTNFLLDLGIFFHLDVFGVVDETFTVPITDFDLSAITGNIYVGTHDGTPDAVTASVAIENVAPTAQIDRTGTALINGVPTFLGPPAAFSGTAKDPGRDDLTLSWDFDDGLPSPDISTTYPVPHEVSETRAHTFDATCLYRVGFKAVDDDLAFGEDHVPVLFVAEAGNNRSRLEGYWEHQFSGNGSTDFDAAQLECYLRIIGHVSVAFNEAQDASTIGSAHDVLQLKQNAGSAREQLDRELLVAWLNFCNGAFMYMELVDGNHDGIDDTPFANVLAAAELVRLNPSATTAQLKEQTRILHAVNNSRVGGAGT